MKKLIQICLIAVLVFVLFQAAVGAAGIAADQMDQVATSQEASTSITSLEDAHVSSCLVRINGVICVKPLVGWNS